MRNPFHFGGANPENWRARVQSGQEVVILLHGSMSSQGFWIPLLKELHGRGITNQKVVLSRNFDTSAGLKKGMEVLSDWLQEQREANPNVRVSLVGHSWGGILAAYAAFVRKEPNLKSLYLLAARCAHDESEVSYNWHYRQLKKWGVFKGERAEIEEIADALSADGIGSLDVGVVYSLHDGLVPPDAASLRPLVKDRSQIREKVFTSCSHLSILFEASPTIAEWIAQ